MTEVGLVVAFGAGLLSFLSPCVLPLIPGYLSFISGYGLADIREGRGRGRIFAKTLSFVLGFTLVFAALGLLFAGGGAAFGGGVASLGTVRTGVPLSRVFTVAAGIIVIILGVNLVFDFLKILSFERRMLPASAPAGFVGAILFGMAFAAGWSPCIGPILASILLTAAREANFGRSLLLLGAYSLGLALPFIATGLFFDRLKPLLDFFKRHALKVRIVSGILLVSIGLAMAFGRLSLLNSLAARAGFALKSQLISGPERLRYSFASMWLLFALAALIIPLIRKRDLARPLRVAAIVGLTALGLAEVLGILSTPTLIAYWLLFQGA
jgi:cytochrome c-type biogenesis protein